MNYYIIMWLIVVLLGFVRVRIVDDSKVELVQINKCLLPCVFMAIISGVRGLTVGNDNWAYAKYFFGMTFDRVHLFKRGEFWLYNLWVYIIRLFTNDAIIFNFLCAIFIYFSVYYFIHRFSEDEHLSVILFFSLGLFFISMNQTRQTMAVSLLLWGFGFMMEKKIIPMLIMCLLATFIHSVSIVVLPIFLFMILVPKISQKTVYIVSFAFVAVGLLYDKLIKLFVLVMPRYKGYLKVTYLFVDKRSIYRYADAMLALIVQIVLIYVIYRNSQENKYDKMACVLACMNAINLCMAYLVTQAEIIIRIKSIFMYWLILAIPHILSRYLKQYPILKSIVAGVSVLYMLRLGVKDGDGVVPYLFFWQS